MIDRSHSATGAMVAIVPKFPKLLEMLILLPADRDNSGWTPPPLMDKANDPSLLLPAFTANVSVSYSIIISNRHIVIFTRIASVSDRANAHFPSSRVQQTFSLPFSICTISHRRSHLRCPLQFYHQHYCHFTAHRWNRHCCCYQRHCHHNCSRDADHLSATRPYSRVGVNTSVVIIFILIQKQNHSPLNPHPAGPTLIIMYDVNEPKTILGDSDKNMCTNPGPDRAIPVTRVSYKIEEEGG